jgi:hypothetical protein
MCNLSHFAETDGKGADQPGLWKRDAAGRPLLDSKQQVICFCVAYFPGDPSLARDRMLSESASVSDLVA